MAVAVLVVEMAAFVILAAAMVLAAVAEHMAQAVAVQDIILCQHHAIRHTNVAVMGVLVLFGLLVRARLVNSRAPMFLHLAQEALKHIPHRAVTHGLLRQV